MGGLRASVLAGIILSLATRSFAAVRISAFFNSKLLPGDQLSQDGSYELLSSIYSLGQAVSLSPSSITSGGFLFGKPTQGPMVLTKRGDEWDPNFEYLELASSQEGRLDKVVITTSNIESGGRAVPLMDVTLTNAYITGTQYTVSIGNEEIYSISLNYEAITVTYYEYNDRRALIKKPQYGFNFITNKQV